MYIFKVAFYIEIVLLSRIHVSVAFTCTNVSYIMEYFRSSFVTMLYYHKVCDRLLLQY